jgi:integrase
MAAVRRRKSAAARRAVRLDPATLAALAARRKRHVAHRLSLGSAYEDQGLVFATALGHPLNPNNVQRSFYQLLAAAGVPRIRLHDLRHTHATWLLKDGQPVKVVSERLGHTKTSITLDTYAHVLPDMQDGAVEAIELLLARDSA